MLQVSRGRTLSSIITLVCVLLTRIVVLLGTNFGQKNDCFDLIFVVIFIVLIHVLSFGIVKSYGIEIA